MVDATIGDVAAWWDQRPCNIRHSPAPVGSYRYFEEVEARKYRVEPHIPRFAEFGRWPGRWVLEIGCGIGTDTVNFAQRGAHVVAVDVSRESVNLAHQRSVIYGLDIQFYVGDAERLPPDLAGAKLFDLVYSFGVIHHSPHPEKILAEARRVISPRGELRIMVYNRRSTKAWAIMARHPLRTLRRGPNRVIAERSEAQTGCPITWSYTRRSARRLVEGAGFTVTAVEVDHIFPWSIPEYVRYEYRKRWYWRAVPEPLFRWLERRVGWHLMVTARPS